MGISVIQLFATYKPNESPFVKAAQRRIITTAAFTLTYVSQFPLSLRQLSFVKYKYLRDWYVRTDLASLGALTPSPPQHQYHIEYGPATAL